MRVNAPAPKQYNNGYILLLWNLVSTLSKEHKQQLFEKKVLKNTLRSKSDEVGEQFRIFHNEERRDFDGAAGVLEL